MVEPQEVNGEHVYPEPEVGAGTDPALSLVPQGTAPIFPPAAGVEEDGDVTANKVACIFQGPESFVRTEPFGTFERGVPRYLSTPQAAQLGPDFSVNGKPWPGDINLDEHKEIR